MWNIEFWKCNFNCLIYSEILKLLFALIKTFLPKIFTNIPVIHRFWFQLFWNLWYIEFWKCRFNCLIILKFEHFIMNMLLWTFYRFHFFWLTIPNLSLLKQRISSGLISLKNFCFVCYISDIRFSKYVTHFWQIGYEVSNKSYRKYRSTLWSFLNLDNQILIFYTSLEVISSR